jgi:hypothetical protein
VAPAHLEKSLVRHPTHDRIITGSAEKPCVVFKANERVGDTNLGRRLSIQDPGFARLDFGNWNCVACRRACAIREMGPSGIGRADADRQGSWNAQTFIVEKVRHAHNYDA